MKINLPGLKKMAKPLFFIISVSAVLSLNLYPLVTLAKKVNYGRTYSLIHNNVQDFYFYQALMNQGANGNWIIYDPYTTETHKPSIIFSYFTWFGKLSRLFRIPHAYTYHAIRVLSGILFLAAAFRLIFFLKIPYPFLAFIFFLIAPPFFKGESPYMYWWTGMDPVRRAFYLPHHMLGGLLFIIALQFIFRFHNSLKIRYLICALVSSILMAFIHTPSLIILLFVLPPAAALTMLNPFIFKKTSFRFFVSTVSLKKNIFLLIFWIASLLSLAFMVSQTNKGFPWNQYLLWERNLQYKLPQEIIPALGILLPFALIGLVISLFSDRFERIFVGLWLAVPILLIPFAPYLGLSNIRLIQGIPYLPLSILAVLGINLLLKLIPENKRPENILVSLLFLLFVLYSSPSLFWSVKDQIREYSPVFGNTYLDNRLFGAFDWINSNYPPKTKTLSIFYSGNYLPVFTDTVSFIGHSGYTSNLPLKEEKTNLFFKGKMEVEDAKRLIAENGIKLVFQGPEEKILSGKILYPEILKIVYNRGDITLYSTE